MNLELTDEQKLKLFEDKGQLYDSGRLRDTYNFEKLEELNLVLKPIYHHSVVEAREALLG